MFSTYDQWKLRSPDDWRPGDAYEGFFCAECDDAGCPECCEPQPITLEDLDEIAMDDGLDIPAFLRLTTDERRAGWERNPPKPMPSFGGREMTETEKLYRASIERDKALKRAQDEARFAEMRERTAQEKAEREAVAEAVRKRGRT